VCDLETSRMGAPYIYDISRLRVKDYFLSQFQDKYDIQYLKITSITPTLTAFYPSCKNEISFLFKDVILQ